MKYSQCKLLLFKIMYLLLILTNQSRSNMRILPSVSRASGEKQPTGSIFVCKRTTNHHGNSFSPFPSSPGLHQGLKLFSQNIITVHLGYSNVSPPFPFCHTAFQASTFVCMCVHSTSTVSWKRMKASNTNFTFLMVGKHITRSILLF